ncbi:MAG TPA: hypothetical protein VFC47_04880 [Caulobacteraceae bacterium]|nr:hypothetical protein [Caulobacteraceae bacterium]
MPRSTIPAIFALAGSLCVAATGHSPVAPAFGNTIVSTYPDGRTAETWLNADGTYSGEGRRHDASNGHWNLKGGKICFHQSHPAIPFGLGTYCTAVPPSDMGKTWTGKAPTGEATTIRLVSGHVHGGG